MLDTIGFDRSALLRGVAAVLATGLVGGCAAADKTATTSGSTQVAGMNMSSSSKTDGGTAVDGIKPVPIQPLAIADWQGMKIEARAMTAAPFVIFNGTKEQMVKPGRKTSFHLMVMLNDAHTGEPIPYATVWATISKRGKVVYDERQWPMLSAYMGPHYGDNVSLPGAGTYRLSLLVSPPVSARHVEYQHVWLAPHRVSSSFHWKPVS
jgi:hypothetical protein